MQVDLGRCTELIGSVGLSYVLIRDSDGQAVGRTVRSKDILGSGLDLLSVWSLTVKQNHALFCLLAGQSSSVLLKLIGISSRKT